MELAHALLVHVHAVVATRLFTRTRPGGWCSRQRYVKTPAWTRHFREQALSFRCCSRVGRSQRQRLGVAREGTRVVRVWVPPCLWLFLNAWGHQTVRARSRKRRISGGAEITWGVLPLGITNWPFVCMCCVHVERYGPVNGVAMYDIRWLRLGLLDAAAGVMPCRMGDGPAHTCARSPCGYVRVRATLVEMCTVSEPSRGFGPKLARRDNSV